MITCQTYINILFFTQLKSIDHVYYYSIVLVIINIQCVHSERFLLHSFNHITQNHNIIVCISFFKKGVQYIKLDWIGFWIGLDRIELYIEYYIFFNRTECMLPSNKNIPSIIIRLVNHI